MQAYMPGQCDAFASRGINRLTIDQGAPEMLPARLLVRIPADQGAGSFALIPADARPILEIKAGAGSDRMRCRRASMPGSSRSGSRPADARPRDRCAAGIDAGIRRGRGIDARAPGAGCGCRRRARCRARAGAGAAGRGRVRENRRNRAGDISGGRY